MEREMTNENILRRMRELQNDLRKELGGEHASMPLFHISAEDIFEAMESQKVWDELISYLTDVVADRSCDERERQIGLM